MNKKLSEICDIQSGGTPSRSVSEYWTGGNIPWVKISDFEGKSLQNTEEFITEEGLNNSSAKIFKAGTILYTIFATLGEVCILNIDAATNQAIAGITIKNDAVNKDYLYHYLCSLKKSIIEKGRGVAQNNINMTILKNIEIPLPPLEIQREIAYNLDKAAETVDICRKILEKLDYLVKAKFMEMFGDPITNPMGWETTSIGQVVTDVRYGTSRPSVENGKYSYLRMNNITYDGHLDLTDLKRIDIPDDEVEKCIVRNGDVLFNRTNSVDLVGKTCVFDREDEMIIAGYIIRVRLNDEMLPIFLSTYLNTKSLKKALREMSKGAVNQANINAKELQGINIYLPPLPLQERFAEYVKKTDLAKSAVKKSLEKAETLRAALMQKYFG